MLLWRREQQKKQLDQNQLESTLNNCSYLFLNDETAQAFFLKIVQAGGEPVIFWFSLDSLWSAAP